MKRISVVFCLMLMPAVPALANADFQFSTQEGAAFSWQISNVGGAWQLAFVSNTAVVDSSNPVDATLQGDYVNLPTMTFSGITVLAPGVLMATLTPSANMTIVANTAAGGVLAGDTVFSASALPGAIIVAGTTYTAYSDIRSDLAIAGVAPGYGSVLPQMATDQAAGGIVDLSFSGASTVNLASLLTGANLGATAVGNLSGTTTSFVTVIPAPGAFLLTAIGTLLTGWLRRRRFP